MKSLNWKVTYEKRSVSYFAFSKWLFLFLILVVIFSVKIDRRDPLFSRDSYVCELSGESFVKSSAGEWSPLKLGRTLLAGDSVRVKSGDLKICLFISNSIYMKSGSWIKFSDLSYDTWEKRGVVIDHIIGELWFSLRSLSFEDSYFEVLTGKDRVRSSGGVFSLNLKEDGELNYFSASGCLLVDSACVSENSLDFNSDLIAFSASEYIRHSGSLMKNLRKSVIVVYGDYLYGVKQNWSNFVMSLLIGDRTKDRYLLAWIEEVYLESIILSNKGEYDRSRKALDYATKIISRYESGVSSRVDGYVYYEDLKLRLYRLFDLSKVFDDSYEVSLNLASEIFSMPGVVGSDSFDILRNEILSFEDVKVSPSRKDVFEALLFDLVSEASFSDEGLKKELFDSFSKIINKSGDKNAI